MEQMLFTWDYFKVTCREVHLQSLHYYVNFEGGYMAFVVSTAGFNT